MQNRTWHMKKPLPICQCSNTFFLLSRNHIGTYNWDLFFFLNYLKTPVIVWRIMYPLRICSHELKKGHCKIRVGIRSLRSSEHTQGIGGDKQSCGFFKHQRKKNNVHQQHEKFRAIMVFSHSLHHAWVVDLRSSLRSKPDPFFQV